MYLGVLSGKLRCKNNINVKKVRFPSISSPHIPILYIGIHKMIKYHMSHISVKFLVFLLSMKKVMSNFSFDQIFAMSRRCTLIYERVRLDFPNFRHYCAILAKYCAIIPKTGKSRPTKKIQDASFVP